ncbi:homeobox protein Wariai-like [Daktulosphaira vitifoliae]|uniref:homeobox protein Wariai-like n=1 Tax=Daktulosphaira vitifoliae TaxID=58002 RepID=UPI0021AA4CAC|nr:homeobox protein Wariai-like [Daktulosphaira vitifoliae]
MDNIDSAKKKFFQSCATGNLEIIKAEIFHSVTPYTQDKFGNNCVHIACLHNQFDVLNYLLKTIKIYHNDIKNKFGRTALNIAASQGACECISTLLNRLNCDLNSSDNNFNNTPLHWCVVSKCLKGVELLLIAGADFTLINKQGKTPLQLAENSTLDIFHYIHEFIKKKKKPNISILHNIGKCTNISDSTSSIKSKRKSSKTDAFYELPTLNKKIFKKNVTESKIHKILANSNVKKSSNPFFLNMENLKDNDHLVLNLLEKSIEPIDETSFVSSILNSGKVIQLTEAGILALEYTKNNVNIPIPEQLVKSFLDSSTQVSKDNKHLLLKNSKEDNTNDSKEKGIRCLIDVKLDSDKVKNSKTFYEKSDENNVTNCLSNSMNYLTSTLKNKTDEFCPSESNQLMCINQNVKTHCKWVEEFISLLGKNTSEI